MKYVHVKGEDKRLRELVAQLKSLPTVEVGILDDRGSEAVEGTSITLATLGMLHDHGFLCRAFGRDKTVHIPARSWLNMPLNHRELHKTFRWHIRRFLEGKEKELPKKLGEAAVTEIRLAFLTSGYGTWKPLKDSTLKNRRRHGSSSLMPLIDTGRLMSSISWKEKKRNG